MLVQADALLKVILSTELVRDRAVLSLLALFGEGAVDMQFLERFAERGGRYSDHVAVELG